MFAAQYARFGPPSVLTVGPFPAPHAGPGEIRIEVRAAGVSPVDAFVRAGRTASQLPFPHIPGVDAAGVVDEVGPGVTGTAVGDEVFGTVDVARLGGASAQYAVLKKWEAKPAAMAWESAGAAGTSVETATRALDLLGVREGMSLLIYGAAGGVGSVAVQLAAARGAVVTGTGSAANQTFIASLGATPLRYGTTLPRFDSALDVAGAGSLAALVAATGSPASVVTIADFAAASLGVRLSTGDLGGEPNGWHGLAVAAQLFMQGRFDVPLREVFPLERVADAHELVTVGPRRGKIALSLR